MARTTIDVTYPNEDGSPRTPGRPVVHPISDRNLAQPHASMVAMRVDIIGGVKEGANGNKYAFVTPYYLHAQETEDKEAQPFVAVTNRPSYDRDGRLVRDNDNNPTYTKSVIISGREADALAASASHLDENKQVVHMDVRNKPTANGDVMHSLYVAAPLEMTTDRNAPVNRNNGKPVTHLRPVLSKATAIDRSLVPDDRFWTKDENGRETLNLDAVDEFQAERSKELESARALIREGRGGELVSKITGKPFAESSERRAEAPARQTSAPSLSKFDQYMSSVPFDEAPAAEAAEPEVSAKDSYADSLNPNVPDAGEGVEMEGPAAGL